MICADRVAVPLQFYFLIRVRLWTGFCSLQDYYRPGKYKILLFRSIYLYKSRLWFGYEFTPLRSINTALFVTHGTHLHSPYWSEGEIEIRVTGDRKTAYGETPTLWGARLPRHRQATGAWAEEASVPAAWRLGEVLQRPQDGRRRLQLWWRFCHIGHIFKPN